MKPSERIAQIEGVAHLRWNYVTMGTLADRIEALIKFLDEQAEKGNKEEK